MMHIYTVKWGDKYGPEYVNRIYKLCCQHVTRNFEFHCLTEDPTGLHHDVNVIPFPEWNYYEKWWNKMHLFDREVVTQKGEKLFFDLDIDIQRNVNDILDFWAEDSLCFLRTHWHDMEKQYRETRHVPHKYTDLNSSVLRWNDSLDTDKITKLMKDYPSQIFWYYRGIDNFFHHRKIAKIKYFPVGWAYSYNNGYIFPTEMDTHIKRNMPYVCLYDSMGRPEDVKF